MVSEIMLSILIWGFVIFVVVRLLTAHKVPPGERKPITLDQIKRAAVAIAIALLVPLFINLIVVAVVPQNQDTTGFIIAIILSLGGFVAGFAARKSTVVSGGVTVGSLIGLVYAIGVRYSNFDPWTQTAIIGMGLLISTVLAYWAYGQKDPSDPTKNALSGIKGAVASIAIFIFALMFIFTFDNALNPTPKYPDYPQPITPMYDSQSATQSSAQSSVSNNAATMQYNLNLNTYNTQKKQHDRNSFAIVLIISTIYLIIGIFIHAVSAVSIPFIIVGLVTIIYTIALSFNDFGAPVKALISGIAIVVLIGITYWKLEGGGHHTDDSSQKPPSIPPEKSPESPTNE